MRRAAMPLLTALALCAGLPGMEAPGAGVSAAEAASGRVLSVGPDRALKVPSAAAAIARRGDTVRIDAGEYRDCAVWRTPGLTIEGVGGYAHVRDVSCEGKAIWVFHAAPATVRRVEFSGAAVPRRNGAGIRWEGGGRLTVEDSRFHGNQMGILTHNRRASQLVVLRSRFERNGACETFCGHAVYAGAIAALWVQGSTFEGHRFGHHIKSRALVSTIVGNWIVDGPEGTASYAINLPNSGTATIRHNVIEKGPASDNVLCGICIGEEIRPPAEVGHPTHEANPGSGILVERNMFRNDTGSPETVFVWNRGPHGVTLRDNVLSGAGTGYLAGPRPVAGERAD